MTVEAFVKRHGGRYREYRGGWLLQCPLGTHQDNTPSFSLSTSGLFYCWSCRQGGNYTRLLHDVAKLPWKRAAQVVNDLRLREKWTQKEKRQVYEQENYPTISKAVLGFYDVDWPEAYALYQAHGGVNAKRRPPWALVFDKGILPETLLRFQVGYDKELQRITIPVFNERDKLLGMVGRACRVGDFKYVAYHKIKPSRHIYNLHATEIGQPVVVVEGAFDVWALYQWKIPFTAVATMTSHISNEQVFSILEKHAEIYVFFDGDGAGERGAEQTASALTKHGGRVDVIFPSKGVADIKQMNRELFMQQVGKRKTYPFTQPFSTGRSAFSKGLKGTHHG